MAMYNNFAFFLGPHYIFVKGLHVLALHKFLIYTISSYYSSVEFEKKIFKHFPIFLWKILHSSKCPIVDPKIDLKGKKLNAFTVVSLITPL